MSQPRSCWCLMSKSLLLGNDADIQSASEEPAAVIEQGILIINISVATK